MILGVVDRFTKITLFVLIKRKDRPTVARANPENDWKYHGFGEDVVSDSDGTFIEQFFTDLSDYFALKRNLGTAHHPQLDGQMERINPVTESYPQSYCNYEQNDWVAMLAIAEYAYNNSKHSATKISPLSATYGCEPSTI
jgi:hypothetical protein